MPDGKRETVITDDSWKASTGGIREADILNGETYNANLEPAGWKTSGFDERTWKPVQVFADKANLPLQLYPGNPVRIIEEIKPVAIKEQGKGKYVVDLGSKFFGCYQSLP